MDSIQPQYHGLNLTAIRPLKLALQLLMITFFEVIYSLRYNTLITENLNV